MWVIVCVRGGRRWVASAWAVEGIVAGFALWAWAWVGYVAACDAVEKVERRHCSGCVDAAMELSDAIQMLAMFLLCPG